MRISIHAWTHRKYGRGGPKRIICREFYSGEVGERAFQASRMCGSTRLNGFDLLWLQSRSERTIGTNRTVKKVHRMGRKAAQSATRWPKAGAQLTKMKFQKLQKLQNASIALAPTALVLKKSATRGPKQG